MAGRGPGRDTGAGRGDIAGRQLLSPRRVGDANRSRVLQTLVDHGPMSRAELARLADVTRATIGNIVQSLIDAGVLEEQDNRLGGIGKPPTPIWFAPRAALSAVLAFDEHQCAAALVDATGAVLAQVARPIGRGETTSRGLRTVVLRALDEVCAQARVKEITGIGVAVPAMCNAATGEIVASSVIPALKGSWLRELLSERYDLPIVVDTDSRAQALAEKWFGAGRGIGTFASVQIGAGVGAGVVLEGTVLRAHHGIGGEFGHTLVERDGLPCRCGRRGCWQTIAGTGWLRSEGKRRGVRGAAQLDPGRLVRQAEEDPAAASLLRDYADNIAIGLTNVMHVYHVRRFVLNGDILSAGEPMRFAIENAVQARVFDLVRDDVDVVLSELGDQANLLGAAALVLSDRFQLTV